MNNLNEPPPTVRWMKRPHSPLGSNSWNMFENVGQAQVKSNTNSKINTLAGKLITNLKDAAVHSKSASQVELKKERCVNQRERLDMGPKLSSIDTDSSDGQYDTDDSNVVMTKNGRLTRDKAPTRSAFTLTSAISESESEIASTLSSYNSETNLSDREEFFPNSSNNNNNSPTKNKPNLKSTASDAQAVTVTAVESYKDQVRPVSDSLSKTNERQLASRINCSSHFDKPSNVTENAVLQVSSAPFKRSSSEVMEKRVDSRKNMRKLEKCDDTGFLMKPRTSKTDTLSNYDTTHVEKNATVSKKSASSRSRIGKADDWPTASNKMFMKRTVLEQQDEPFEVAEVKTITPTPKAVRRNKETESRWTKLLVALKILKPRCQKPPDYSSKTPRSRWQRLRYLWSKYFTEQKYKDSNIGKQVFNPGTDANDTKFDDLTDSDSSFSQYKEQSHCSPQITPLVDEHHKLDTHFSAGKSSKSHSVEVHQQPVSKLKATLQKNLSPMLETTADLSADGGNAPWLLEARARLVKRLHYKVDGLSPIISSNMNISAADFMHSRLPVSSSKMSSKSSSLPKIRKPLRPFSSSSVENINVTAHLDKDSRKSTSPGADLGIRDLQIGGSTFSRSKDFANINNRAHRLQRQFQSEPNMLNRLHSNNAHIELHPGENTNQSVNTKVTPVSCTTSTAGSRQALCKSNTSPALLNRINSLLDGKLKTKRLSEKSDPVEQGQPQTALLNEQQQQPCKDHTNSSLSPLHSDSHEEEPTTSSIAQRAKQYFADMFRVTQSKSNTRKDLLHPETFFSKRLYHKECKVAQNVPAINNEVEERARSDILSSSVSKTAVTAVTFSNSLLSTVSKHTVADTTPTVSRSVKFLYKATSLPAVEDTLHSVANPDALVVSATNDPLSSQTVFSSPSNMGSSLPVFNNNSSTVTTQGLNTIAKTSLVSGSYDQLAQVSCICSQDGLYLLCTN